MYNKILHTEIQMKKYILILAVCLISTGCATHQGTDGRTYYWIAPIPNNGATAWTPSAGVTTYQGTVNGRGYTITSFK